MLAEVENWKHKEEKREMKKIILSNIYSQHKRLNSQFILKLNGFIAADARARHLKFSYFYKFAGGSKAIYQLLSLPLPLGKCSAFFVSYPTHREGFASNPSINHYTKTPFLRTMWMRTYARHNMLSITRFLWVRDVFGENIRLCDCGGMREWWEDIIRIRERKTQ